MDSFFSLRWHIYTFDGANTHRLAQVKELKENEGNKEEQLSIVKKRRRVKNSRNGIGMKWKTIDVKEQEKEHTVVAY